MRTKQLQKIMGSLALFILMISVFISCEKSQPVEDPQHFDLDVTFHTENLKDLSNKGFGFLKFRQDPDTARIITLDTYIFNLLPNHSYLLQRAANPFSDPTCTNASWLTLGMGLVAQDIATDSKGDGHETLFRAVTSIARGTAFHIDFQIIDAVTMAPVLSSDCYEYIVR
ncbi:MAG TPA: hypothetical protein VGI38_04140 [Puia sp.]